MGEVCLKMPAKGRWYVSVALFGLVKRQLELRSIDILRFVDPPLSHRFPL